MTDLPLSGVRVLEFGYWVAVPSATQILAQMGAEVIKFESANYLDPSRGAPPYADGTVGTDRSGHHHIANGSKLSCTLNLQDPRGIMLAKRLASISDVVTENYAYGVMPRLGLGYEQLREANPGIIMYSSSGLGKTGPRKQYVAYGITLMPNTGLSSLTGYGDGFPGTVEPYFTDHMTPGQCAFAVLLALYHRELTGEGQSIELSMTEAQLTQLPEAVLDFTMNGKVHGAVGNRDEFMAPHNTYPCKGDDEWVAIAVRDDRDWEALCRVIGPAEWVGDPRFADGLGRWKHQEQLDACLETWTRTLGARDIMDLLQAAGVPAGASLDNLQLLQDPHLQARGAYIAPEHLEVGCRALPGLAWRLSRVPEPVYGPVPLLGQHNYYVFHDLLGLSDGEFADLVEARVIY